MLYRNRVVDREPTYQLILPAKYYQIALESLHAENVHFGVEKTLDLVRRRFYWVDMNRDVKHFVGTCGRCLRRTDVPTPR